MRSSLIAAIVAVASPAFAQPVTSPSLCSVDLVRAPEDVRNLVERSLVDARHCSVALEVRVVPTADGLYIMARDDRGSVRDRVVPDAQTAAALIASWADDGQPAPIATIDFHTYVRIEPIAAVPGAPGLVPAAQLDDDAAQRDHRPHHWLSQYLMFGGGDSAVHGLRLEADLLHHEGWTAGVSGTLASSRYSGMTAPEQLDISDLGATVYLAHPFHPGGWEVQPAVGLGFVYTRAFDFFAPPRSVADPPMPYTYSKVSPIAEASLVAAHTLVGRLSAAIGVIVTAYGQHFDGTSPELQDRSFDAVAVGGFRFGFL
jgi:hypothetical protein